MLSANVADATDPADELITIRAELTRLARDRRRGLISPAEYADSRTRLSYSLLGLAGNNVSQVSPSVCRVFLSYNHGDRETAVALKRTLETKGVSVRLDADAMQAGADIRAFILDSIRSTDVTVCLISERSLLSGWVATETLFSLADEALRGNRRFIAGFLDEGFFDPQFRLRATERIDGRIEAIDKMLPEYIGKRLDTDDLNGEKSRLYDLRNNLGKILQRLKESLTIDLRPENFDEGVALLVRSLRERAR